MKISKGILSLTTTQTAMAQALGISQQRVSKMLQEGTMVADKQGALLVVASLKNYYNKKAVESAEDGDVNLQTERALHEKAKREIAELRLAKMQGNVYDAKTVELVMTEMLSNLRTQLLGLPSKLAPLLEKASKEKIYETMTKELEERLQELSEYKPDLFMEDTIGEGNADETGD